MRTMVAVTIGPGKRYRRREIGAVLAALQGAESFLVVTGAGGHAPTEVPPGTMQRSMPVLPESWNNTQKRAAAREAVRQYFLSRSVFTHLLMLDCDIAPPHDIIARLAALSAPAASAFFPVRGRSASADAPYVVRIPLLWDRPDPEDFARPMRGFSSKVTAPLREALAEGSVLRPAATVMGATLFTRDALRQYAFRAPDAIPDGWREDVLWFLDARIRPAVDTRIICRHLGPEGDDPSLPSLPVRRIVDGPVPEPSEQPGVVAGADGAPGDGGNGGGDGGDRLADAPEPRVPEPDGEPGALDQGGGGTLDPG